MTAIYSKIAQQAAEHYARTGVYMPVPNMIPQDLLTQKACYVSLVEQPGNRVRGSFGTPLPQSSSLAQEIITNTVEAIVQYDIRMRPIDAMNYGYVVGVLGPIERITDKEHLRPRIYGLYMRSDKNKMAILLPGRLGIDTADEQIATAIREAGINQQHETITMYRFPVTSYGP